MPGLSRGPSAEDGGEGNVGLDCGDNGKGGAGTEGMSWWWYNGKEDGGSDDDEGGGDGDEGGGGKGGEGSFRHRREWGLTAWVVGWRAMVCFIG
ncbi:hypothetical protein ACFX2J_008416 [Malus domestica]